MLRAPLYGVLVVVYAVKTMGNSWSNCMGILAQVRSVVGLVTGTNAMTGEGMVDPYHFV